MHQDLRDLIEKTRSHSIPFNEVVAFINDRYVHHGTAFRNGDTYNTADQNQGSARVFGFAKMNGFDEQDTLLLFAEHYQSVLNEPDGDNHQNIRQFMLHHWQGIVFDGEPLTEK